MFTTNLKYVQLLHEQFVFALPQYLKQIDATQEILSYFYFTMSNYLILFEVFVCLIIFILILVFIIAMFVIGVLFFSCLLSFVVSQNCSRQR